MRRALVIVSLAAGIMLGIAGPAGAHAALLTSTPADGATLATPPTRIDLSFSEPPDPSLSVVHVLDAAGGQTPSGVLARGGTAMQLILPLTSRLADGVYTVTWQVTSATDGHVTGGYFSFGVGQRPTTGTAPPKSAPATPGPSALAVLGKTALYAGLSLILGAAATGLWAFGGHVPSRRRLLSIAGVATLGGAWAMVVAEHATVGVSWAVLARSQTGRTLLWLLAGAAVTLVTSFAAARIDRRATLAAAGGAAAVTMLIRVIGGHADNAQPVWFELAAQWIHFAAVGVWVGGFVPVLLLLRERRGTAPPTAEVRRYSFMAGIALAAVVVTGSLRAVSELGGVTRIASIFATAYGTTLAIKVAFVIVLIGLGAWNRYRSLPAMNEGPGMLRRVMSIEVATGVVILGLTATLTSLAPAPPAAPARPAPRGVSATGSDFATTIRVTLTVTPASPGTNTFDVAVKDYGSGAPVGASAVSLRFSLEGRPDVSGSELDLRAGGPGAWSARGSNLAIAGTWDITVLVRRGARAQEIPLQLATAKPDQQLVVTPPTNGLPALYTMTLPGGEQLQAYNDPGTAGPNQLHLTAFDTAGQELPLASASITATAPGGDVQQLTTRRFGAGHFVASVHLTPGSWHYDLVATAKDGTVLQSYFDQTIG